MNRATQLRGIAVVTLAIGILATTSAAEMQHPARDGQLFSATKGTGSLYVLIRDSLDSKPRAMACIAVWLPKSNRWRDSICTDSDRGALFEGLPAGQIRVGTIAGPGGYFLERDSVKIVAGRTAKVVLKLNTWPPAGGLNVMFRDADNKAVPPQVVEEDPEPQPSASVTVRLVAASTRRPITGMTVRLEDALHFVHAARTDSAGEAEITVKGEDAMASRSTYVVRVWTAGTLGYEPVEFRIRLWAGDIPLVEMPLRKTASRRATDRKAR